MIKSKIEGGYMIIGLVSAPIRDNDIENQISVMEYYLKNKGDCELLVFGESFLHGSNSLTWDYEIDKEIAIEINSEEIRKIKFLVTKYKCGVSFGFIEKYENIIYSSNLVIDKYGLMIDLYRNISPRWGKIKATRNYRVGNSFQKFLYKNTTFAVCMCKDLWEEGNIRQMKKLDPQVIIYPVYIDYTKKDWEESIKEKYNRQMGRLDSLILMVNSYDESNEGAKGGVYVFYKGNIIGNLPMEELEILRARI